MAKKIDNTELNDATPVEAPENVRHLVAETAAPKRSRKAQLKESTTAASGEDDKPDYAALGVEETQVEAYEQLRLRFNELGRRSTDQVFDCGEVVAGLQELSPDQDSFTRRAKAVLKLSRRGAENYANVYHKLRPYRARLVRVAMVASTLYDLASAEPEQVEKVIAAREAGQQLTGNQVKEMLGKKNEATSSPEDGGPAGLRARIAEKTQLGVPEFMDAVAAFLEELLVVLEPHRRGSGLWSRTRSHASSTLRRILREQLEWLTWRAVPAPPGTLSHSTMSRWSGRIAGTSLWRTLAKVGGFESWPAAGEVGPWLADTVVPQLAWVLGERSKKCFAVVDRMAAAAEAERAKAEKAKEREKAEAKKAREKAKAEKLKAEKRAAREAKAQAKAAAAKGEEAANGGPAEPAPSTEA